MLVPLNGFQVIAHELLVEAWRAAVRGVVGSRPKSGGIRCEAFVNEHHFVVEDTELELGICNDDPALRGVGPAMFVEFDSPLSNLEGNVVAEKSAALAPADVLVMTRVGLSRGGKYGLGKTIALPKPRWKLDARKIAP